MKPVEFPEQNVTLGKDQPQYVPLPVYAESNGDVTCCFEMSPDEIAEIVRTGRIWYRQMTFGRVFQPILPMAHSPFVPPKAEQN